MPKFIYNIIFSIFLISLSTFVNASLITNGSFEEVIFEDDSTSTGIIFNTDLQDYKNKHKAWDVFYQLPGWQTTDGHGIELQKNIVTLSQDGFHHVELDSHPYGASNAVMTQTLNSLTVGTNYLLEFYYKPRTNSNNDNGINVFWYDAAIDFELDMKTDFVVDGTRNSTPSWALQSVLFTAKAQTMNLSFASFGKQNTLGGLIDNVSLNQVTTVPEPSTLLMFFAAITFLFVRKQSK
jgi:hypothetical protein